MKESLEGHLKTATVQTARILGRSLEGRDLSEDEIVILFSSTGGDLRALLATAEIEATARQLKDLYAPAGKKKKAPKVDLDVLVTRIRESMERQANG